MRKSLLAALATAALMNGCTTIPYAYQPGPPAAYRDYDDRGPPPAYRNAYPEQRADRDDRDYRRPLDRGPGRFRYDRCRSDDPRDCTPPPDFFVQPLPPDYQPAPAPAARGGTWRVQFGAFRQRSRATALRTRLANMPALSTYQTYLVIAGGLTRVQAGPLPSTTAAHRLCARIRAAGHACIVSAA
jgi:hypothetical protein